MEASSSVFATGESTCSECLHWVIQPVDPMNLTDPSERPGICRERLHVLAGHVRTPAGVAMQMTPYYPVVPPGFPACGQFQERDKS